MGHGPTRGYLAGRVGSGREVVEMSRVGSARVGKL